MPGSQKPTVQLCSLPQNAKDPKSVRCVLAAGHAGPHEGFSGTGTRVKFESSPKP
jgi:hypothetical protein